MDSSNNMAPERQQPPRVNYPNAAPNMGGMAANMAPSMPEITPTMPEVGPIASQEMLPNPELQTGPGTSNPQPILPDPTLPVAVPLQQPVADDSVVTNTTFTSAPAAAADEDLIEKEWVDQAKKVISTTKDNPHEQARLVSELMRDYVRKRYGKEVGKAPDNL